ncbi:MAG: hypothetical protein AB1610_09085 [Nitrospirota bacterium]
MPLIKTKKTDIVAFPRSVFETAETLDDLEDWLLSKNLGFIKKMRKTRREDIQGKGKDWAGLGWAGNLLKRYK